MKNIKVKEYLKEYTVEVLITIWTALLLILILLTGCATRSTLIHPKLVEKVKLVYPAEAEAMGIEGETNITLKISEQGFVDETRIVKTSGYDILDKAALEYAEKLKYDPAMENGKPVSIWMSLVIDFNLKKMPFDPVVYTETIKNIYKRLEKETNDSISVTLRHKALVLHERYIRLTETTPEHNYNNYLEKFIDKDIKKQWAPLWKDISLRFLVFYDYILRNGGTDEARYAKASLVYFFRQDLNMINMVLDRKSAKTKEKMQQVIFSFMNENINH